MTEINNKKTLLKYKEKVYNFLIQNKYTEESPEKHTHLSYGPFSGKFVITKEKRKDFMELYINAIKNGVDDLVILEKQKEYAPIIIDIDLKIPCENYDNKRLYDNKLILNIAKKYIDTIQIYLNVKKDNLDFVLLEKNHADKKDHIYKDGFHIMFPLISTNEKIRHLIRYKVVEMCNQEKLFDGFLNGADDIIDKAVVSSNSWFLYGSKKPGSQTYKLSKIFTRKLKVVYDHNKKEVYDRNSEKVIENGSYDDEDIIKYLSIHGKIFCKKYATKLNNECAESDIDAECETLGIGSNIRNERTIYTPSISKELEIDKATKYVAMLDHGRSDNYIDWIRVGFALHSIHDSLLYTWIDFSKKSKQFKNGDCEQRWKNIKTNSNGNILTIRSLAYWAKLDNPKLYEAYIREEFKSMMNKSLNGETYHLAKSFHAKYSDKFVCSSIDKNIWWEFKEHRWCRIEGGHSILVLFSEEFANEYNKEIAEITNAAILNQGFHKEELQRKRTKIDEIVTKLMNCNFKKTLLTECKNIFYDSKFEQKLDSNIFLIGFENGIYDLEQASFRDGRPDDYVTLSTNHNYTKWSENDPYNKQIFKFFEQVLPNDIIRRYFLNVLCTCLSGQTKEEKLYIMTGSGSNGKSLTIDLMINALGDYYMSCPITIITRKRGQSNETSPEKVRMKGKRCGVFQEADKGEKLNVGMMKEFTGGDKILVRDLFKGSNEMIEFKPQMKYFLTCNELPDVPSGDDGTWRRLRVIDFSSKFTDNPTKPNEFKIDNTLKNKIEPWGATFISYLIHIYNTEYKLLSYLVDPDEVMASTNQYKMENDFYTEYVNARITITNNNKNIIFHDAIYEDFKNWYKNNYSNISIHKKLEVTKVVNKIIGNPNKRGYYEKIIFKQNEVDKSDFDVDDNNIDN